MNTIITSRGDIMHAGMLIATEKGLGAINIRAVARVAGISVGAVYNYFPNKSVLLSATVRKIWADIFYGIGQMGYCESISTYIQWLFGAIKERGAKYPDFFQSQGPGLAAGGREVSRQTVRYCLFRMERGLNRALKNDQRVKPDAFDCTFTKGDLSRFLYTNMLTMLARGETDCSLLIRVIERVLY